MNKRKRKTVKVRCAGCSTVFDRVEAEHKRSVKLGRSEYCTRSCTGRALHNLKGHECRSVTHLDPANRHDEFTGFRDHLRRVRNRQKTTDLDLEYLKNLWEAQGGKCTYTGVTLTQPRYGGGVRILDEVPRHMLASLDRIDSDLPYEKGNVQFVVVLMNWAKNDLSDSTFREAMLNLGLGFIKGL